MVELIAATADRVHIREGNSSRSQATEAKLMPFASCVDDFSVEVRINLGDINVDNMEMQPEMVFGNLVKRRAEVKVSTLVP